MCNIIGGSTFDGENISAQNGRVEHGWRTISDQNQPCIICLYRNCSLHYDDEKLGVHFWLE